MKASNWGTLSRDARAANWRGPLVIDEFPHLAAAAPALPSVLQNWIDSEAASGGLLVAIAGSSQRMMQGLVLDANAPLFGRAIEAFALDPLPAGWIGDALGGGTPIQQVQACALWGGVPRYWELAAPFRCDLESAVDALALDPMGPLHREPDRLLLEEQPPALALRPVLDAIGGGAHRVSEIAGRVGQPATSLSRPLARLVELGLVEREQPFGSEDRNTKRTLYRLADPYFRFWFRVVAPSRARLHGTSRDARLAVWTPFRAALESQTWEDLCRQSLPGLGLGAAGRGQRWWQGAQPEWDLLARTVEPGDGVIAGEAKWSTSPVSSAELDRLCLALARRPLPADIGGLPARRALFVPELEIPVTTCHGVTIVDAAAVLRSLR